jgi:hypothetical protein
MSRSNPVISFFKPIASRVLKKKLSGITSFLDLVADENGNIDVENIIGEMTTSLINTQPFGIALNAQYHDYCELLKAWFGDNIDTKVIESAVNFWFKDDDYKGGNKVYKYFREA